MHHRFKILLLSLTLFAQAKADPNQITEVTLARTISEGLQLNTKLSRNIYRTETYQDTENYYVDVPYEETEEYTDYETRTDREYLCHDIESQERQCHNEAVCTDWSVKLLGFANSGMQPLRERPPGVGPAPYEPPTPAPRPEPDPNPPPPYVPPEPPPRPEPICREREVCEMVPTTRQECGYEQVEHSYPVTRTRTVTRYRQEERTREITRTREVFEYQQELVAQLQFSEEAQLLAGEHESFKFELVGTESNPDVKLTPVQTVFGYQIADKRIDGGRAVINLKTVPRYKASQLAQSTVQNLLVAPATNGATYKFLDNALFPRIESHFKIEIQDSTTHEVIAQTESRLIQERSQQGLVTFSIDSNKKYDVLLSVHRQAPVLIIDSGVVDFQIRVPLKESVDTKALSDESLIVARVLGLGESARVNLTDRTENYSSVATKYVVSLVRKNSQGKSVTLSEKMISRSALTLDPNTSGYLLSTKDLGLNSADATKYLKPGAQINVVVEVDRVTADGKKIQFWKDNWTTLK